MKKLLLYLLLLGLLPNSLFAQKDKNHLFEAAKNMELFNAVYKNLDLMYVDTLDANDVIGTGIKSMLRSLDPYTEYYPESETQELRQALSGKYGGIGALIRYNQQLNNAIDRDAAGEAADTGTSYVDLMDVGESLGYIKIPKIDVNLPIYEGTSDEVLLKGVGHLEGSSYPLGGDSTHSVLTGHRGLAEAVLFTDLDKMQEGDKFYLHVMDEVLAYQVDQVKVVEPEHTEDLEIIPGGDYCTLVTCTPYAINTHRMLVRGVRVPYNGEDEDADTPQAVQYQALNTGNIVKRVVDAWPWISVTGSIIIGGEALLLLLLLHRCKKREEED